MIELDCDNSKKNIDLNNFKTSEDRAIVILVIVILKNVNNLILELGQQGVNYFLYDINKEIIESQNKLVVNK